MKLLGWISLTLAMLPNCITKRPRVGGVNPTSAALAARMQPRMLRKQALSYPVPYRLFVPTSVTANHRYPLIVYLHGAGGRGQDNLRQLDENVARMLSPEVQSLEPFFLLAPQCPENDEWVNRHESPPYHPYDQARVPESDAFKGVREILEALVVEQPIDADRVYVTGVSMGGSGTWDFVTRHPGLAAAAVPVTGVADPSRAKAVADLPIWAFHGTLDAISPIENARIMRRSLEAAGATHARFSELAGVGHDSWTRAYADPETFRWLLAQRRTHR